MLSSQLMKELRATCKSEADFQIALALINGMTNLPSETDETKAVFDILRKREQQLQLALESANQAVWDWNRRTGDSINVHWAEMLGYDPDEFNRLYTRWRVLIHPDDLLRMQSDLNAYINGSASEYRSEYRLKKRDGAWMWVLSQGNIVEREPSGDPIRIIGTRTDITQRKLAELQLQTSERKYRLLFENANDAIMLLKDGYFCDCNFLTEKLMGFSRDDFLGKSPIDFSPETQANGISSKSLVDKYLFVANAGERPVFEWIYQSKSGKQIDTEISLHAIDIDGENIVQATIRDITDRMQNHAELRNREIRFRHLFEDSPIPMMEIDASELIPFKSSLPQFCRQLESWDLTQDYTPLVPMIEKIKIVGINRAALNLLELNSKEQAKLHPESFSTEEFRKSMSNAIMKLGNGNLVIEEETRIRFSKKPTIVDLQLTYSIQSDWHVLLAFQDISKRKRMERMLQASELKFSSAFNNNPNAVTISSMTDGIFVDVNEEFVRVSGYSREELVGRLASDFFYEDQAERNRVIAYLLENPKLNTAIREYRTKSGEVRTFLCSADMFENYEQEKFLLFVSKDITQIIQADKLIRDTRESFDNIIENNPMIAIQGYDRDGTIIHWNSKSETLYGQPKEGVIGKKIQDVILTTDVDKSVFLETIDSIWNSGKPTEPSEWSTIASSGERVWVYSSMFPVLQDGVVKEIFCLDVDVTALKQTQERLQEIAARYKMATLAGKVGISELDPISGQLFIDENILSMLGYDAEDFDNTIQTWISWIHPSDFDSVKRQVAESVDSSNKFFEATYRVRKKDGGYLCLENSSIIERNIDGLPIRLLGTIGDVTDGMMNRMALQEEKERLAVTLRSIGDGVITTDRAGRVSLLNRVAEKLTGWTQEEALGKPLHDIFVIVDINSRKPLESPVDAVLRTKKIVGLANHTKLLSRNGNEYVIADSGAPIFDANSVVIGVVLVFRDVTSEKKVQEELQRSAKLESLSILAGGIAHDFNNLLTGVVGSISFVRMFPDARDETIKLLAEAEKSALRAKDLTQQLLMFAKGGTPIRKSQAIKDILIDTVEFALRGSKSTCKFELPADLWTVEIDAGQISQVFQNLVINADQAMPKGGSIIIRAKNVSRREHALPVTLEGDHYIRIEVIDTGIGIPSTQIDKIFDPYFTTKESGSGLGLATTYSIVKYHSGAIEVSSQEKVGSTFTVYLPVASANSNIEASQSLDINNIKGKGRILVLDDDDIVRSVLERGLKHFGYEVTITEDGRQTVEEYQKAIAENRTFDLVIMDLTIPGGVGGLETLKMLREINPAVKAIVSSGYSTDPVIANYRDFGFIAVAVKPYKINEMGELIRKALASIKS